MGKAEKTLADIKSLKIQGARNVAKAGVDALVWSIEGSKAKTPGKLASEVRAAAKKISRVRPTEPMLRNMVSEAEKVALSEISSSPEGGLGRVKKRIKKAVGAHLREIRANVEKLWDYGAELIPPGALVVTHCHSSTVTGILKRAKKKGKRFSVVACETRPRWQGRITAGELAGAKIPVTLTVDLGVAKFLKKADMVLVGADAITATGDLINKVGTSGLARLARMNDVSFFCASETLKYDPLTAYGKREEIEQRDAKEVWERPPRGVKIANPAFDVTPARYISGYITELGIVPPQNLADSVERKKEVL